MPYENRHYQKLIARLQVENAELKFENNRLARLLGAADAQLTEPRKFCQECGGEVQRLDFCVKCDKLS